MQAIVYRSYGSPDVLELAQIPAPEPGDEQVLIRVSAAGINPYDWRFMRGEPLIARKMMGTGLLKPNRALVPGSDAAGMIVAVGANVTRFQPGDEVYACVGMGGLAELVAVGQDSVARKPANLSFEAAAAVPMAAVTALQSLRDVGGLRAGQSVLINGACGGVGSFAVQMARCLGAAEVVGVCSAGNAALARSLGATEVVDYATEDFTRSGNHYDLVFDAVGNRSIRSLMRAVAPNGVLVVVGGGGGRSLGPIGQILRATVMSRFNGGRIRTTMAHATAEELDHVTAMIEAGEVTPVIDRKYALSMAADAMRHLEGHHVKGKLVIDVSAGA
jgi:NADPH:quinone reductase-like Zn-dependent oxidoreductase